MISFKTNLSQIHTLQKQKYLAHFPEFKIFKSLHQNSHKMDTKEATEKFHTNLESWQPGLQDRQGEKLPGPTKKSEK